MKTSITLSMLHLAAALTLSTAAIGDEASSRHRADTITAMRSGDVGALVKSYSPAIRLMPEYHPTLFGEADARAYFVAFFERFEVSAYQRESFGHFEIGARLVEIGRFDIRLTPKRGGASIELPGKYVDVWETSGEVRKLVVHGWNYDRYPASQEPLRFASPAGRRTAFEARVPVRDALSFELAALNRLLETAITQRDGNIWSRSFADDAILLPNHHAPVRGRAEIDAYVAEHVVGLPVFEKLDIRNDAIVADGRYVMDFASHVANWRRGDDSGVNTGKNLRIWRRAPTGGLALVLQIGMYD